MRIRFAAAVAALCLSAGWNFVTAGEQLTSLSSESAVQQPNRPFVSTFSFTQNDANQPAINFISDNSGEPSCEAPCNNYDAGSGSAGCDPGWCEFASCPRITGYGFLGYDSFKGIADSDFPSNYGASIGLNLGGPLPYFQDRGIAWQAGASYGAYDWRGSAANSPDSTQSMFFSTLGLFRRADASRPFSWALAVDQLAASQFGIFSQSPYLAQVRGQIGYAISARNEVGVWGTVAINTDAKPTGFLGLVEDYRAINQCNLFWHHKFDFGGDSWLYAGVPIGDRLATNGPAVGSLGNFVIGGMITAPLSDNVALYGNFAYLSPSGGGAGIGAVLGGETNYVGMGLIWYPGRDSRSATVGGRTWMPLLPVVNNGTMMVDHARR